LLRACDTETNAGMNDQQLRDECVGIYLAGFGGTSTALTWVWYLLGEHPEVEYKLQAEIDNVLEKCRPTSSDVTKLRYTKTVIQESMRLYPSSWLATRVLRGDDEVGGYSLKAEATVLLSPYLTHRLPQFWNQPEVFNPERFDPERSEQLHPYAYFPFGGGSHLCLGKHFALMEMQLIIAMMVQKYRLRGVPGHPITPSPGITLHLRHGLRMTLQRRS
jgi:cytochrome P450